MDTTLLGAIRHNLTASPEFADAVIALHLRARGPKEFRCPFVIGGAAVEVDVVLLDSATWESHPWRGRPDVSASDPAAPIVLAVRLVV